MPRRPKWEVDETKDLALLLRIASTARQSIEAPLSQFDAPTYLSIGRLHKYGLIEGRTYRKRDGDGELIEQYRLTSDGKRACSSALDGFEKHLPAPEDR